MSNSSSWPIDKTLSGAPTPGQSGPGSNGNKGVLHILQSFSITEASPSNCLVSYPGHSLGRRCLTPLQRCSRCILQPQPSQLGVFWVCIWRSGEVWTTPLLPLFPAPLWPWVVIPVRVPSISQMNILWKLFVFDCVQKNNYTKNLNMNAFP